MNHRESTFRSLQRLPKSTSSSMLIGMTLCAISLGGNLGDVPATFAAAIRQLNASPIISNVRMSRLFRTAPMGPNAGDVFWNAAAVLESNEEPFALLNLLHEIEQRCGRTRTTHWGPRTLDLDLLLAGDTILDSPELTVPHRALWHRRFVLDPLVELIPEAVHPVFQLSIRALWERLLRRPLPVGWAVSERFTSFKELLGTAHPTEEVADQALASAAIVFADWDVRVTLPQVIRLPNDEAAAKQMVTDVLTAALDEPVPV